MEELDVTTFFISYNQAGRQWAEWIAWQLESAGHKAFIQAWDIRPGQDFVMAMQNALEKADRTIAVLSPDYISAKFTQREWTAAFAQDPTGERGSLVPVRVREVKLSGMWVTLVYIDLVGVPEDVAKRALLSGIEQGRGKPTVEPLFPVTRVESKSPVVRKQPAFPISEPVEDDPFVDWGLLTTEASAEGGLGYLFRVEGERITELKQVSLTSRQREMIDMLIEGSERNTQYSDAQKALFELLIPSALRESLSTTNRLCVVVDQQTAEYPWELLVDPQAEFSIPPLGVYTGLVRQFKGQSFCTKRSVDNKGVASLIIGDPFGHSRPELPGAQSETKKISNLFESHGELVHTLIRPDASEVVTALFSREYRLVHISAHGVYDHERPEKSGVLLRDDLILTAGELTQLREIPEFVFVNCGHLGRIELNSPNSYGRFAAAFAAELVHAGVCAVAISGWAVDDAASTTFTVAFYEALLNGKSFAEVVRIARGLTYEKHPEITSWGAFHCYGRPDFSLEDKEVGLTVVS